MKKISRKKKLFFNTIVSLIYQFVTIVCGLILPKFLIPHFGSKVNGLVGSITQFLAVITLLESGVGAVVQTALYKPLADGDDEKLSKVIISSHKFFNKIMWIMCAYVIALIFIFYFIVKSDFGFVYTASLIVILAFSYIAQHYLYVSYRLLLNADQLSFIQLMVHTICLIINTVVTILLINLNFSIHLVKLFSSLIFAIQPLVLKIFVDKKYNINLKLSLDEEPIKQKWNGFAQHISSVILNNTDTVVLTIFSTLENISIYNIYYLVVHGMKQIVNSLMNGIQPLFGNMYAKNEIKSLTITFNTVEWLTTNAIVFLYTMVGLLIIPFVRVYTKNFTDANYVVPTFGILITLAYAMLSLRTPYEMMIKAAGHYKETQASSLIEAFINIIISIIFVFKFGLVGVAIGTFVAMAYRTIYLVYYLSKNIIFRKTRNFYFLMLQSIISIIIMSILTKNINLIKLDFFNFIIIAIQKGLICLFVIALVNMIFNRNEINNVINLFKHKNIKKKGCGFVEEK